MKTKIIAELAQAHDGSVGRVYAFIDALKEQGVDAIKFQTHIAQFESSREEPWRIKFSYEDEDRFSYWKRMEFSKEQWISFKQYVEENGMEFISSPFSVEAAQLLGEIGTSVWKIASGELQNFPMIDYICRRNELIYVSTGMSNWTEIDNVVNYLKERNANFVLMQATTQYPAPLECVGVNVLNEMRSRYGGVPLGYSDHSGTIYPSLIATYMGVEAIEVHACMDKRDFGPDTKASLTINEIGDLVKGVRAVECMLNNPVDKDKMAEELSELKIMFGKSIYAKRAIKAGQIITQDDIGLRKPAIALPSKDYYTIVGKRATRNIEAFTFLTNEEIE